MGILGKFFGAKLAYPSLDSSTLAAKQLESALSPLEKNERKEVLKCQPT